MKRLLLSALFGGIITLSLPYAHAQTQFAYIDEAYILERVPEFKQIKGEMDEYNKKMQAELDLKRKEFDQKLEAAKKLAENKDTPVSILESKQKELQELEKSITDFASAARADGGDKFGKRLNPVYQKVTKAVEQVAQDKGGIFVFRREACLFQVEENNVSDLVLQKLGITPEAAVAGRGTLKGSNKIGYFDAEYVIPQLEDYKKVQSEVEAYQKVLQKQGEKLQNDAKALATELQNPQTNEAVRKAKQPQFEALVKQLQELEQTANGKIQEKYLKLMEPVNKKAQEQLDAVARENGYTFVFKIETSLKEPESDNVSDLVLKKFGVTPAPKKQ